ncbi:hypothetical protein QUF72_11115 [Desulfobacterales bacterium HSG2]|nr:hypothetical protein [Desulfobacterales bacterium HSG2]
MTADSGTEQISVSSSYPLSYSPVKFTFRGLSGYPSHPHIRCHIPRKVRIQAFPADLPIRREQFGIIFDLLTFRQKCSGHFFPKPVIY